MWFEKSGLRLLRENISIFQRDAALIATFYVLSQVDRQSPSCRVIIQHGYSAFIRF